jgi:hypothetical protein
MRKPSSSGRSVSFGSSGDAVGIPADQSPPSWVGSVAFCGWLYKRGAGYRPTSSVLTGKKQKTFNQILQKVKGNKEKARYFVLHGGSLLYFQSTPDTLEEVKLKVECKGNVDLHDVTAILTFNDEPTSFALQTRARTFHFRAVTPSGVVAWVESLHEMVDSLSAGDGSSKTMARGAAMLNSSPFDLVTAAQCVTMAMEHSITGKASSAADGGGAGSGSSSPRRLPSIPPTPLSAISAADCGAENVTGNVEGTSPGLISVFAPKVFTALRAHWGCTEQAFEHSICHSTLNAAGGGAGRSGSLFFFSWDQHFVTKSISKAEVLVLQQMLLEYVQHVQKYPNTMLPRFLSLIQVQISAKTAIYAMTMTNVFDTPLPLHHKFDMKGSSVGRHTKDSAAEECVSIEGHVPTLKDINFTQSALQVRPLRVASLALLSPACTM